MKNNGRPTITLKPHQVLTYGPNTTTTVRCPGCGNAKSLKRSTIVNHPTTDHGYGAQDTPCDGAKQRVNIPFTPDKWREHLDEGVTEAGARRATSTALKKPKLTPRPAVSQMHSSTARLRQQLAEHKTTCLKCRRQRLWCETASRLENRIRHLHRNPAPAVTAAEMRFGLITA